MEESDLKEIVSALDTDTLAKLHKVVTEVEGGKKVTAKTKKCTKTGYDPSNVPGGNFKEASDMRRAIFNWSYDIAYEAMKEINLGDALPMGCSGKYLLMDEVFKGENAEKWKMMAVKCACLFMDDQVDADVPYIPSYSCQEHCVYIWDVEQTDKFLEAGGVKPKGKSGKELIKGVMEIEDDTEREKAKEMLGEAAVKFMKAVAADFPDLDE